MGSRKTNQDPALLFFAVMTREDAAFERAARAIEAQFGPLALRDERFDFDPLTRYYEREFGNGLRKQIIAAENLVDPEFLVEAKIRTNEIEIELSNLESDGAPADKRLVNIDPGYLNLGKIVLASTKDHWHRLYVGRGVFEELTLRYRKGEGYLPLEWTYPDYRMPERLAFFEKLRDYYRARLRALNPAHNPTE
jgi:hypothetical protein